MKIVQSYWSHPSTFNDESINARSKGGFIDKRFHYMSWALSCLSLKRFYKKVELITDKAGSKLLVTELELPYTDIEVCLDQLNHYHPNLWAIGKIKTYQLQTEPFLHIDSDIYVWKKLGNLSFHKSPLIVQNVEYDCKWNIEAMVNNEKKLSFLPEEINGAYKKSDFTSINAGVIGGTDLDFF